MRELPVGWGAQKLLWGQKLSPRAGDLVLLPQRLARASTRTRTSRSARPDNLFEPLPGDRGARGRFSAQAPEQHVLDVLEAPPRARGCCGRRGRLGYDGHHEFTRKTADSLGRRSHNLSMATLELKDLHVALEDGTEIVKGVDLKVSSGEVHAIMGPNGSGKSTLAYAIAGHPAYEITSGQILLDGEDITEAGADERAQAGLFLAFQYPHAIPGVTVTNFLRQAINAVRKAQERRRRRPDAGARVPQGVPREDGRPEGQPRARVALPERRVLGRREEARRDPADGDAEAEDRGARRDRLRSRHRRAEGRRRRRAAARRPGHGRARDHALPADPQLHQARLRARLRRRQDRRGGWPRARREARGLRLRAVGSQGRGGA